MACNGPWLSAAIASALACGRSPEEIEKLALLLTAVGDQMALLALCAAEERQPCCTDMCRDE